jgi:cytochrome P450
MKSRVNGNRSPTSGQADAVAIAVLTSPRLAVTYPPGFAHAVSSLRGDAGDPLAFLEELARAPEGIVPFSLAGRQAFLLKEPALVEAVLVTNPQNYVKAEGLRRARRLLGNGLLTAEGEQHRRQRSVIQPAFHRQQLHRYAAIMVAETERLSASWRDRQPIDLGADTGGLTLAIVCRTVFGAEVDGLTEEVRAALKTASATLDPMISLLAPVRRVRPERRRLLGVVDRLVADSLRRDVEHDTVVSLLAQSGGGSATIADQTRDDLLTLLLAGHDTIANALVWTWLLLARHTEARARLEAEVDAVLERRAAAASDVPALVFTRSVLAESLRLLPPAWIVARTAVVDHRLQNVPIPAGALIVISPHVLHRDPRFFPDPQMFDPSRWLAGPIERPRMAFIPFGAGPRACIGEGFAWMEGVLVLATIAQRWRLEGEAELRPRPQITLRPPEGLRMTPHARTARR